MKKISGWWRLWHGGTSECFCLSQSSPDNIISRMIFPNEFGTKKKRIDNDTGKIEPDPGSIRSKAKRARLARAEERRRQAAEEAAEEDAQTED